MGFLFYLLYLLYPLYLLYLLWQASMVQLLVDLRAGRARPRMFQMTA